ncbi:MAG: cytochrome c-type biogenesis protein CcmH [Rhizobiales bacterium]|nr:cytochrome c-type biogenesis protein CcmH [Hyphomicrobiales bacterium]
MARQAASIILAILLLLPVKSVLALEPSEMLKDPALEARARALSAELRCLVCQNQSIDESEAPLARDLRVLIRERLAAGDSDAAIMDFVVARYGEFVLLRPRFSLATALLWLGPFVILAAATAFILLRRRRPIFSDAERALSAEEKARLESHPPVA